MSACYPATLINPVRSHLDTIVQLLSDTSQPEGFRRRLVSLAAETSILLGWITKDLGDHGTAQQYFLTAIDAAAEADDRPLGAYAIASASTLPAFRHNAEQTIHLLTEAEIKGIRADHATGATRAYVYTLEAEAHGRAKDHHKAFLALDHAEAVLDDQLEPGQLRPRVPFFDDTRLLAERGLIAVRLDQPAEAQAALTEGLDRMPPDRRIRSRFLTNLAKAHLQRGQVDQACDIAIQSLDVTKRSNINIASDELRAFRDDLEKWATTSAVRRFDDELRSLSPL